MNEQKPHSWPIEFGGFPKIPRLHREIIITEKIDGTNALVYVDDEGGVHAGSRTRWITPEDDNYGFAAWVKAHADELFALGPGKHFGEWWGRGINRGYGLTERRFSLFNVSRWVDIRQNPLGSVMPAGADLCPLCCSVVPVLYTGAFSQSAIVNELSVLGYMGSEAAPGYMNPEGIVIYHVAAGLCFKVTIKGDEQPKGAQ